LNNWILIIFIACLSNLVIASDKKIEISEDEIIQNLEKILGQPESDYLEKMAEVSEQSSTYILQKEEECSGEYSSILISSSGEKTVQKKKLTLQEKKLCHYMLINFRIRFTQIAFKVRRDHLAKLHKKQIKELAEVERLQITELENLAGKYK